MIASEQVGCGSETLIIAPETLPFGSETCPVGSERLAFGREAIPAPPDGAPGRETPFLHIYPLAGAPDGYLDRRRGPGRSPVVALRSTPAAGDTGPGGRRHHPDRPRGAGGGRAGARAGPAAAVTRAGTGRRRGRLGAGNPLGNIASALRASR